MQSNSSEFMPNSTEKVPTSLKEAEGIMGENFLGPKDVKEVFGIEVKDIPEIPFNSEELAQAKKLGQDLILYVDKLQDGSPLTIRRMYDFLGEKHETGKSYSSYEDMKESPSTIGWRLTSKEVIPESCNKSYLEQTEILIKYLKENVFANRPMPEEYQAAIDEFNDKKGLISSLIEKDSEKAREAYKNISVGDDANPSDEYDYGWEAIGEIQKLKINRLTRETLAEAFYRLTLLDKTGKMGREVQSWYFIETSTFHRWIKPGFWPNSTSGKKGDISTISYFGGYQLNKVSPTMTYARLGACLSRKI